jgi:hypothetical protein
MRVGGLVLLIWLVIGAIAAGQRGYYGSTAENCAHAGTIVATVVAGPLNYVGVNPKVSCHLPSPSSWAPGAPGPGKSEASGSRSRLRSFPAWTRELVGYSQFNFYRTARGISHGEST